jgi:hypothetical protein
MNSTPEERQLGEYRLQELLSENAISKTWLAQQVSISRLVLVDELRADQESERPRFLADVRAKAAVDHPLIGSVYEAVAEPEACFYAHERLVGATLQDRLRANEPLSPGKLTVVLRRISEAQLHHESSDHSTSPLTLAAVHLDENGVVRLDNLAVAGPRASEESDRDIAFLGNGLVPLVADGRPGATRLLALLGWMRGENTPAPITWAQIRDFCLQIEHQLADSMLTPTQGGAKIRKKQPVIAISVATGLILIGIVVLAMKLRPPEPSPPPRAALPGAVLIPSGIHPTPDGLEEKLPSFRIAAHEVTLGQYAEFLETLGILAKENHARIFDAKDQPVEKTSHEPADWPAQLAAAKARGMWEGQRITLDSPVTGVDWWDASAYAEWKKARLPTQEEWFAAANLQVDALGSITPGGWIPVTEHKADRTPAGLLGMAGSVSEWTAIPAPNPSNPLGERLWVIIGGSFLKPGSNALSREWTADRSQRRPDLGFRLVYDAD